MNKGIYEINYKFLKERMDIIIEDLMKAVYHPKRLQYYLDLGYNIFDQQKREKSDEYTYGE